MPLTLDDVIAIVKWCLLGVLAVGLAPWVRDRAPAWAAALRDRAAAGRGALRDRRQPAPATDARRQLDALDVLDLLAELEAAGVAVRVDAAPDAVRELLGLGADDGAAARTGAGAGAGDRARADAVRAGADGACVREGDAVLELLRTDRGREAARRMVLHKINAPTAAKLETIRAGFPDIRARSGDPRSKYARLGSPLYDLLFGQVELSADPAARRAQLQQLIADIDRRKVSPAAR